MSNETVRIVFYVDGVGGVEKVRESSTEACSECGTEKPRVLSPAEIEALGFQAGRAIGSYAHGRWYDGLIKGLLAGESDTLVRLAVRQRTKDVRTALSVHDALN